jgi:hypothetical protein
MTTTAGRRSRACLTRCESPRVTADDDMQSLPRCCVRLQEIGTIVVYDCRRLLCTIAGDWHVSKCNGLTGSLVLGCVKRRPAEESAHKNAPLPAADAVAIGARPVHRNRALGTASTQHRRGPQTGDFANMCAQLATLHSIPQLCQSACSQAQVERRKLCGCTRKGPVRAAALGWRG